MVFLQFSLHCHLSPTAAPAKSEARASWLITDARLPPTHISAHFPTFKHPQTEEMKDESSYAILRIPPAKGMIVPYLPQRAAHFQKALLDLIFEIHL